MGTLIHKVAHGLVANDTIDFGNLIGGEGLEENTTYYVLAAGLTADDFAVSLTAGGAAIVFTTDITDGVINRSDVYTLVADGVMDPPTTPTTLSAPPITSALHNNVVRMTVDLPDTSENKSRSIDVAITKVVSAAGDQLTGNISDNGGVPRWFDADLHTWATCLNGQSKIFSTTAAKTFTRIRISWHYGGLFNQDGTAGAASGASGPFTLYTGPTITGPWTALLTKAVDPAVTAGITYPNDFAVDYEVPETTAQFFKFTSTAAGNNDLYELEAQAFTTDWTKAHIHTLTDGTATFSMNALGDTMYAARTRVQDVFGNYGSWSPSFVHTTLAGADGLKAKNADDHIADTTAAHAAASVSYAGASGISATDVEAALDELAAEKADVASAVMDGDTAGGDLSGTYPNPSVVDDSHAHTSATAPGTAQRAASSTTPAAVSTTGAVGTGATDARDDHVHAHEAAHINHDTTWAAKGDLVTGTANDTAAVTSVGADDTILMADAAAAGGVKWVASASPSAVGTAAVTGTADTFTRGDHVHAHEAAHTGHDTIWDAKGDVVTGSAADTAVRTAVGADGTFLKADSTKSGGVTWAAASGSVAADVIFDAKGDLAVGTGADTAAKLTVGADDTILMADSAQATGLKWVASASPSAVGTAAAVGTADTFTRGDHVHAHEAAHIAHDTIWDTAGDLVVGSGADTAAKLAAGAAGGVLAMGNSAVIWNAGSAFPASKATGDRYYRTDLHLEFYWDGTQWLSTQLFTMPVPPQVTMNNGLAATTAAANRAAMPFQAGGSDIYIVDHIIDFFVNGGTALGASHKWVGTFDKVNTSNAATTLVTDNIASGTSSVWRETVDAINALVTRATYFVLQSSWTKTGTPGNLLVYESYSYRIVAT